MKPIEILNTLAKKIFDLRNENTNGVKFTEYVSPQEFKENNLKRLNGQLTIISKEEYLKDCIGYFLLNVLAMKNADPIQGYKDARQMIKTHNGFGMVDDVRFTEKTQNQGTKTHRIRIFSEGKSSIGQDEMNDMTYWSRTGDYVIVNSMEDFYKWYVSKFGEVDINL